MQPVPSLKRSFCSAFTPFSSPGTRKGWTRCACTVSVLLASPSTEGLKSQSHTAASEIVGLSVGGTPSTPTAQLGHRSEASNIVPGRSQFGQGSRCEAQAPSKSGPGRPKGLPAWNKGKCMSASAKQQISKSQKERWKKQPALRGAVSSKLKGKEPWNKGQSLSQETRQKMSIAKQGHMVPRQVCAKMSRSHAGFRHSEVSRATMSQAMAGIPKAPEHKARIAAAQRRRHAAARVLTAVEAFHRSCEADAAPGLRSSSPAHSSSRKSKGRRSSVRCLSGRSSHGKSLTKAQIMTAYKAELREYRLLQEELGPWTQAFKAQHGRKPALLDVERTGISWLLDKFKAYIILRDRLLSDTSILRDKLEVASPEVNGQHASNGNAAGPAGMKAASYATKLNANAPSAKRSASQSAATFTAALEYRRQQQALADTAAISAAAAEAAAEAGALEAAAAAAAEPLLSKDQVSQLVDYGGADRRATGDKVSLGGNGILQDEAQHAKHTAAVHSGGQQASGASDRGQHARDSSTGTNGAKHAQHAGSISNGAQHAQRDNIYQESVERTNSIRNGDASSLDGNCDSRVMPKNGEADASGRSGPLGAQTRKHLLQAVNSSRHVEAVASKSSPDVGAAQLLPSDDPSSKVDPKTRSGSSEQSARQGNSQSGASSASSVADDAMAAAIASIHSRRADQVPEMPAGGKVIPAPTPNTSPRIKSALLAAQEYRKQKAAKTAALAVAAAAAAQSDNDV